MKYKFYTTSEETWGAMIEAASGAKKSIYLESYILGEDELTADFFRMLEKKAGEGVKVKIIVDRVGNFLVDFFVKNGINQKGIEVLVFRRFFNINHRKILIIDEKIAFIGGVNIRGKYAKWLDLHVRLEEKFLIKRILASFAGVYRLASGGDSAVKKYLKWKSDKPSNQLYSAKIFLIEHWPFRNRSLLKNYYKKKINEAKKSVVIVTPYFIPHRWLIDILKKAANRGVSVEIILPMKTDIKIADTANWIFAEDLNDSIKFLFLPEMNHAKVLLIDGKEGMVGSNNIDAFSFESNLEAGIIFYEKHMIGDLKGILNKWRALAVPYGQLPTWRPWYYQMAKFFTKLIQPLL